jgi:hypothetical protein
LRGKKNEQVNLHIRCNFIRIGKLAGAASDQDPKEQHAGEGTTKTG